MVATGRNPADYFFEDVMGLENMATGNFYDITIKTAFGPVDLVMLVVENGEPEITAINGDCLPGDDWLRNLAYIDRAAEFPGLWLQVRHELSQLGAMCNIPRTAKQGDQQGNIF